MRLFSYRNRRNVKIAVMVISIIVILLILILLLRFFYLERFLVYSQTGAYFSFDNADETAADISEDEAGEAEPISVQIEYQENEQTDPSLQTAAGITNGIFISIEDLNDIDAVKEAVKAQLAENSNCTIVLELKTGSGRFCYSSELGENAGVDVTAVDALIRELKNYDGVYLAAAVPAFQDSDFALDNQDEGLPIYGGALWMDQDGCYWLDPAGDAIQSFIVSEMQELSLLGFQAVILEDFIFPSSTNIVYSFEQSATQILNAAAENLAVSASQLGLTLAFEVNDSNFSLPDENSQVVLQTDSGAEVSSMAEGYSSDSSRIVFLTDSHDTRFDQYNVLRPIS